MHRWMLRRLYHTAELNASTLTIQKTTHPKHKVPLEQLTFGQTFSDHMLEVKWTVKEGWGRPLISAYHPLVLDPSASVFHYSIGCIEGMKVYKDQDGNPRLFRPMMHLDRLNRSAARVALPNFDTAQLLECIKAFVKLDKDWIPNERGYSLYLRPTMIGIQSILGFGRSDTALLFVIGSPVGSYHHLGFKPIKLYVDDLYVRTWPKGTGDTKVGCNYAASVLGQKIAADHGCKDMIWLFGPDLEMTETGTMSIFVFFENEKGHRELVTSPLNGLILPSVTRDSVLTLCRQWGEFEVSERPWTLHELLTALENHRVLEMFGCSTAQILTRIHKLVWKDQELEIPSLPYSPSANQETLMQKLFNQIVDIQHGYIPHDWSFRVD
jgi:branched-chain amino acid aminotransferase